MTDDVTDDMTENAAPVDFIIIEFPEGRQNFSGEVLEELARLVESGTIRLVAAMVLMKDADGSVDVAELSDLDDLGPLQELAAELADFLAEEDVADLAAAMEPGSVAGVIVYENVWAGPFAAAARRAGGRLLADGRIHSQSIVDALEAEAEWEELDEEVQPEGKS